MSSTTTVASMTRPNLISLACMCVFLAAYALMYLARENSESTWAMLVVVGSALIGVVSVVGIFLVGQFKTPAAD